MAWNNLNSCFSHTEVFGTTLKVLSAQNCSEVVIYNNGSSQLYVYDNNFSDASNAFVIPVSGNMTFRGVTNSDQVSANFGTGSGSVSYRTQFFSNFPMTVY